VIEPVPTISETRWRVNYSETDQLGVVYHARYLVWVDVARSEHLRRTGVCSAELESVGVRLAVGELRIRYRRPARYDDEVRIRCWVREARPRRVVFGYAIDLPGGDLLVTAETAMMVLDAGMGLSRLPVDLVARLSQSPDPARLF
jgi:acyl-CoA thioester hydrolase